MATKDVAGLRVWQAITEGDLGELRRGLEGGVLVGWKNEDEMDRTLLHHASAMGRVHLVKALLEKGANVGALDEDDATPLHRAAKSGSKQTVEMLIEHGANVNATDFEGNTPLHLAAKKNMRATAQALLMAGALKDLENKKTKTAFELCTDRAVRDYILQFGEEEEAANEGPKRRSCWHCGKIAANRCTGCRVANYCSGDCQKQHWKEHKEECLRLKKANTEAQRVWSVGSLDAESKELVAKADLPPELTDDPENLFALLNIVHFQNGKVFSTRHPTTGKKLITIPSSIQEEVVLSFFSAENEARLIADGDPKMSLDVDKDSRKRNVFRATIRTSGEPVAVKILQFKDTRQKTLFMREIRIVKENASPNLMHLRAAYKVANKLWMVTDWIDGGTLKEALALRPFIEDEILYIAREVLQGLDSLHKRGVAHRDIKPSNVMLTRDGRVVIIDFGLCADALDGQLSRMVGSPFFVAPEMVQRQPYSYEVDIWSLGITLLQLCNNRLPYDLNPIKTMFMYAAVGVPKPFDDASKWSLPFQECIGFMIKRIPKERLTADELMRHPVFRNRPWKKPQGLAVMQTQLASIWPEQSATVRPKFDPTDVSKSEMEIATGMASAPRSIKTTGVLLDEDVPAFLPEALPGGDIGDLD